MPRLANLPRMKNFHFLFRAVQMVWQAAPLWTLANAVLLLARSVLPLLTLYLVKLIVDLVASPNAATALAHAWWLLAGLGGVAVLNAVLTSIGSFVNEMQTQIVSDYVQQVIQTKSYALDLAYYDNSEYHDTLHRAQQEAAYRPAQIVGGLVQVVQSGFSLIVLTGFFLSTNWPIALLLIAVTLPGMFLHLRYTRRLYLWQRLHTAAERIAWYLHALLTVDTAAAEIRALSLGQLFIRRFQDVRKQLLKERKGLAGRNVLSDMAAQSAAALAIFGSYAYMVFQTLRGVISLGSMVMYYQAFQRAQGYLQDFLGAIAGLYENTLFLTSFYAFLDLPSRISAPPVSMPLIQSQPAAIVLDHVSFQYPTSSRKALEDISLTIRPGDKVAFVGENGSGKTTLIKLLCRLYDPTQGTITIGGTDLREIDPDQFRQNIAVLFQDFIRYHFSALENIWMGDIQIPLEEGKIRAAARASGADPVLSALPGGYQTILSNWLESGEDLSLGQWQKVALARAFFRPAPILILDEPTSSLDPKTEWEIFQTIYTLASGKTLILSTHRLANLRPADCIFVLENGKLVEQGSHAELLRQNGRYAGAYHLQAESYQDA